MKWITISRKMGTQGSEIARRVAGELGYPLYDTKAINHMAQELGFPGSVRQVDDKAPPLFQRLFSQRPMVYLERLYSVIYELAKRGDGVFLGRGCHLLLRSFPCVLRVRVTASHETCLRTLVDQGLNREAAERTIKRTDEERAAFVRFAFGVDWEDPERFDLILNRDVIGVELAVSTLLHLVRAWEVPEASREPMAELEALALASRAQAALVEASFGHSFASTLSVSVVAPGKVRVTGDVETRARQAEAEAVLKSVKGVTAVENAILVVPTRPAI